MASIQDIREKLLESEKCNKKTYPDKIEARKALLGHWKKNVDVGSFYFCKKCDGFHLTSQAPGRNNFT